MLSNNTRYKFLQGGYWMAFCTSCGFISLTLQGRGLGTAAIGTTTAVFGLLAAALQPVVSGFCNRSRRLNWRRMLMLLLVPFTAVCALMLLLPGAVPGAILVGMNMLLVNLMMPYVNGANFYYQDRGERINFGSARGIGSALYAVLALLIGRLARRFGIAVVPAAGVLIGLAMLLTVARMPCADAAVRAAAADKRGGGPLRFIRRYPGFALMLAASLMMLTSHNAVNTYLLQIIQSLGGDSGDLGLALAIQAVVEVPVLFLFSRLLKRFRPAAMMLVAAGGYALKAVLYACSGSIAMILLTQLTQTVSFAIYASASVYVAAESVTVEDRTTAHALMAGVTATGTVLGSLTGGWLIELSGLKLLLGVNVLIAAAGVAIAVVAYRRLRRTEQGRSESFSL